MASVFRGLPHEGGSYPSGGSQKMAESLVHTIVNNGGAVLVKARVVDIMIENGKVCCCGVLNIPLFALLLGLYVTLFQTRTYMHTLSLVSPSFYLSPSLPSLPVFLTPLLSFSRSLSPHCPLLTHAGLWCPYGRGA